MAFASALRAGVARVRRRFLRSGLHRTCLDCLGLKYIKGSHPRAFRYCVRSWHISKRYPPQDFVLFGSLARGRSYLRER